MTVNPESIDLATLAALAGELSTTALVDAMRASGHPGVRASHGWVFQHLLAGSPTVGELAELLGVSQQAASKSVAELESLGLLRRRSDNADNRTRRVELTEDGLAVIEAGRAARADLERRLLGAVGEEDLARAKAVLSALVELVGGTDAVRQRRVRRATAPPT